MDPTALTQEQADLLAQIKAAGNEGLTLPKYHPVADRLADYRLIFFCASDNTTETWRLCSAH